MAIAPGPPLTSWADCTSIHKGQQQVAMRSFHERTLNSFSARESSIESAPWRRYLRQARTWRVRKAHSRLQQLQRSYQRCSRGRNRLQGMFRSHRKHPNNPWDHCLAIADQDFSSSGKQLKRKKSARCYQPAPPRNLIVAQFHTSRRLIDSSTWAVWVTEEISFCWIIWCKANAMG